VTTDAGPLAGIRVLDLSSYIAAPYGCTLLADQGAEVLKIEPPEGDNLRNYPSTLQPEGRAFLGVNRGKSGMVLDLKQSGAQDVLDRLLRDTDVLVHNFRAGVPERLGIGYEALRVRHPRLIYCAVSGYGETGPLRARAGYDQVLQSMSGLCAMQGTPEQPQIVYGSVVDYYAAALLASGVASALYERTRTGAGRHVAISLLRSALAMQSARMVWADDEPREVSRDMRSGGITGLHPTLAGQIYLSANTPHFWNALCQLLGLDDLAGDPRYDTVRKRAQNADVLVARVRAALASRSALEWEALLGESVPCAAVRPIEDMFDHPQVLAEGMVDHFDHPVVGGFRGLSRAIGFGNAAQPPARAAPTRGEHTDTVLRGLDYSVVEIAALRSARIVA
jgi:crotonobetainyl-CoA:carnitine CoA-transferase CaiB-like acyl-CoA transferase